MVREDGVEEVVVVVEGVAEGRRQLVKGLVGGCEEGEGAVRGQDVAHVGPLEVLGQGCSSGLIQLLQDVASENRLQEKKNCYLQYTLIHRQGQPINDAKKEKERLSLVDDSA